MNITLSAPSQTIQIVRQWAEGEHTSLNQYIRDVLEEKAHAVMEERKRKAEDMGDGQIYCGIRVVNPFKTRGGHGVPMDVN